MRSRTGGDGWDGHSPPYRTAKGSRHGEEMHCLEAQTVYRQVVNMPVADVRSSESRNRRERDGLNGDAGPRRVEGRGGRCGLCARTDETCSSQWGVTSRAYRADWKRADGDASRLFNSPAGAGSHVSSSRTSFPYQNSGCQEAQKMTTTGDDPADGKQQQQREEDAAGGDDGHETLKYSLLGPSLLKAGQDSVDQTKVP